MSELERQLAAAQAGSREALGRLLEACRPFLLPLAQRQLATDLQAKAGASDLVQETFAEAFRDFPQFLGRTEPELLAWLQRILRHNAVNLANHFRHTDKRRLDRERSLEAGQSCSDGAEQLADDSKSPSGKAMQREEAEVLQRALERLPEDYRRVILLHHRDNLSFEATARQLSRTEVATRRLWFRAVERWRSEVELLYGPP